MSSVAAVFVLYSPPSDFESNIAPCIEQVDRVYIVDNSIVETSFSDGFLDNPKLIYIWNSGNKGLAYALNQAADASIREGFDYLLMFDQDSGIGDDFVRLLLASTKYVCGQLGLVAPAIMDGLYGQLAIESAVERVLTAWTSGSLLSLDAYRAVGPFRECLFIDLIDHEYCLRLNMAGYGVYKAANVRLAHGYGNDCRKINILGKSLWITNHVPVRRYYIMRNRLLVWSEYRRVYPDYYRKDLLCSLMEVLVILFFEKQKRAKLMMMVKGIIDYRRRVFGEYCG